MKKTVLLTLALGLMLNAATVWAASLGVEFNDSSAQIRYAQPLTQDEYGTAQVNARFLYNDNNDATIGSAGLMFLGEPGNVPGLRLGIGAQVYGGRGAHSQDILSLGVGGTAVYAPPRFGGIGIAADLYYAPRVFSLLDAKRLFEGGARVQYAITPKAEVYLGYQYLRADFGHESHQNLDKALRVGFNAHF
ncbi:MAG TPA: YfaZ family outer membrane protein [Desulfuromonadales bacterium]|nr:YfaZ family outer membrane protein [Desulfuromonadales bacterium]